MFLSSDTRPALSGDCHEGCLEGPNRSVIAKPTTKIKVIEDEEAMGETGLAYDFWRTESGRKKVPEIVKCFGERPDFLR